MDEGEHKEAVQACSQGRPFVPFAEIQTGELCAAALLDDPEYVKALQRRASSSEAIGIWSSLTTAQDGESMTEMGRGY